MRRIVALIFLALLLPRICYAQDLEGVPSLIQSPQSLVRWFSSEFGFQMEYPDKWQSPQEMLRSKKGDCEDFGILASAILTRLGIPNHIMIIKFKGLNLSHAVCIWKDKDGSYSFISNQKLYRTRKSSIEEALGKFYPDWESAILTDDLNKHTRIERNRF